MIPFAIIFLALAIYGFVIGKLGGALIALVVCIFVLCADYALKKLEQEEQESGRPEL